MKKFNLEIANLNEVTKIQDKLMAFSVYYDLNNKITAALSKYDESITRYFGNIMAITVPKCTDLMKDGSNHVTFIQTYIGLLQKHMLSDIHSIRQIIESYKSDVKSVSNDNSYIDIIDSTDLSFKEKAELVITVKEHINNISSAFVSLYGDEESLSVRTSVKDELLETLPNVLANSSNSEELSSNLKMSTQRIVIQRMNNNEFGVMGSRIFTQLTDLEKQAYIYSHILVLSGYETEDFDRTESLDYKIVERPASVNKNKYQEKIIRIMNKTLEQKTNDNHTKEIIRQLKLQNA